MNVKAARKGRNQEDVAPKMGTTQPTVSRWERGLMVITAEDLIRIAAVYEIRLDDLVDGVDDDYDLVCHSIEIQRPLAKGGPHAATARELRQLREKEKETKDFLKRVEAKARDIVSMFANRNRSKTHADQVAAPRSRRGRRKAG